ncbi:SbcC/MukB-like Walker B domain-containing protein [Longimicrobium sp.]|uniref:SbcC/MukB-like Walker B domain-containing protein n=1 Tax=Longimicrobium sp. TaxID=2029185 RepID=UPI003B3B0CCB
MSSTEQRIQADFFRLTGVPPRMQALLDAMHAGDPDRWLPRRLILQNYWLFEEPEVFHFGRGNLMLTGQNESGKSTVLVTAITLVLDMMLTPDRVDTMGSNDRSIRYYLIGKDDAQEGSPNWHRERTAYIALEFERGASGVHQTIGIGLRSSRDWTNQKVERWGFVMDSTFRVEEGGFHLHEKGRPLRPGELRDRLGSHGQVTDDQRTYKSAVNDALFGFQTVEDYERFLEMLHVVRTPKLGEGLNPRKVEALLKESLPPIQSDKIDAASDVFSRLDTIEEELKHLNDQLAVARELEGPQEAAVLARARQAGAAYRHASREHTDRKRKHDDLLARLDTARAEVARQAEVRTELASERAEKGGTLSILKERFRASEAFDIEDRLREVRADQRIATDAYDALRGDRKRTQEAAEREQIALGEDERSWTRQRGRLGEKLADARDAARRAHWPSLEQRAALAGDALGMANVDGSGAIAGDLARSSIDSEAQQRRAVLDGVRAALDAVAAAGGRLDAARKASEVAGRELRHADDRFRTAGREAESARLSAADALAAWRAGCAELRVPDEAFDAVLAAVETYQPAGRPAAMLAPLQPAHDAAQEALRAEAQELGILRRRHQGEAEEVDARLRRLSQEPDVEPDRTPAQTSARRLLREHGIAHTPLFAAVDLAGPLATDAALAARVEAALLDAGLLDALIVPRAQAGRVRALLEAHGLGDRWIAPTDAHLDGGGWDGATGWLVPVASAEVSADDVAATLRALGLSGGGAGVVDADGGWRLGPLHGLAAAPAEARVRFLGETARREERRRRIDEARRQLAELREEIGRLGEALDAVQGRERALGRDWRTAHDLPAPQKLHDMLLAVRREEHERERRRAAAELAAEAVEAATRELQQQNAALERATDDAPWLRGRPRADVDAAAAALAEVLSIVRAVGESVEGLDELRRAYAARTRAHDALRLQIEELAPRIAQASVRVQTLDAQIAALEEQLSRASVGREALAEEIRELERRLDAIEKQDQQARSVIDKKTGQIESDSAQEPDYADQLRNAFIHLQSAEHEFRERIEAYPTLEEYVLDARASGLPRAMQRILHDVDPASIDDELKRAQQALQAAFTRTSSTFEELSPALDGDILRFTHELGAMRLDELYRTLEKQQARNETLLEEEDRRLIEQLMLRDVVDAIRDAIRNTRHWVSDINGILGKMKLFKGGIMRLHWDVRTRESTDAFDPRRLDDLLSQRGIALDEARREELLEIFRTMVSDIRRRNREHELLEDYRTALLRMVDYTQWYTLTVQRKDESGRWVQLTKRLYGQGSGGRRTLDLLLPLIAAVSARLASADRAAPRIVGFDEAFAGVDDRNAAEIYALLTELDFCWIMATEKTTALGAEVRGSATYEMLTDGVTVAPTLSLWDGARRYEFIGDELIGMETSSGDPMGADHAP